MLLKNEYLVAKIGFDTEENEPWQGRSFDWKIGVWYGTVSLHLGIIRMPLRAPAETDPVPIGAISDVEGEIESPPLKKAQRPATPNPLLG